MKNILFILPWLPYPLKSGGHQAIFNGIKAISNDINPIITYMIHENSYNQSICDEFISRTNNNIVIEPFIIKNIKKGFISSIIYHLHIILWKIKEYMLSLVKRQTDSTKHFNFSYRNWIEELLPKEESYLEHINYLINKYQIEAVQCEMLGNCSIVTSIPRHIKKIFVHHEIGFIRNQQELESKNNKDILGKAFLESKKIQEIGLLNKYDGIITLSELDKNILEKSGVHVPIYSSIAIVNNIYKYKKISKNYHILTFVGPEFHTPNALGIKWFLENCWLDLKEKDPSYIFNIIGNWSETTQSYIIKKYKDIHFLGFVDDLSESLRNTIMIVPITIGSGIRMKILEAASIGVPIITTTIGVSGITMENEHHCLISDTPQDFINSIIKLKDKQIRLNLIEKAYNLIDKSYSMHALQENRLSIYKTIF